MVRPSQNRFQVFKVVAPFTVTAVILPLVVVVYGVLRQVFDTQEVQVRRLYPGAIVPDRAIAARRYQVMRPVRRVLVVTAVVDPKRQTHFELKRGGGFWPILTVKSR